MTKIKIPKRIRNHVNPLANRERFSFTGFKNNKNIIVDIGSYRGEFGERLLEKFGDEKNFIFFEIRKPFEEYLKKLFESYENVKVFGGNANNNLRKVLEESMKRGIEIEKIFINFPDPWFKEKHHKRRVVTKDFLGNLKE
jgi:tRNA (guanine-N7-)-methyltransferase